MTASRIAALALSALLGLTAAGCSDDGGNAPSTGSGASSSPTTPESTPLTKQNFAAEVIAAQAEAGTAHVEATIEAQGQQLTMAGDVAGLDEPARAASDITAQVGGREFRLITVDQTFYIRGEGLPTQAGKPWVSIDVSDPSNPLKRVFDASNPGNFAAYLEGVTRFEDKGETELDGTPAHRYSVTVDTAKMIAASDAFRGQDAQTLGLPAEIVSDVYVDEQNRLLSLRVELGSLGAFEATFTDYGKDVDITAPPADQVSKFSR